MSVDELVAPAARPGTDQVTAQEPHLGLAGSLGERRGRAELQREVEQLRQALQTRPGIDQAVGIIMATLGCDSETAFAALAKVSQNTNTKVREVAQDLIDQVGAGVLTPPVLRDRLPHVTSRRGG